MISITYLFQIYQLDETYDDDVFGEMFKTPPPTPQNYKKILRLPSLKKEFWTSPRILQSFQLL